MYHRQAFTLIEVLLGAIVLLLAAAAFATVNAQAARTVASSQLSTVATSALQAAAHAIQQGDPAFTQDRALSSTDLAVLAEPDGRATRVLPALTGSIRAAGGDPPTYAVTVNGPDFTLTAHATAPGGTP